MEQNMHLCPRKDPWFLKQNIDWGVVGHSCGRWVQVHGGMNKSAGFNVDALDWPQPIEKTKPMNKASPEDSPSSYFYHPSTAIEMTAKIWFKQNNFWLIILLSKTMVSVNCWWTLSQSPECGSASLSFLQSWWMTIWSQIIMDRDQSSSMQLYLYHISDQ